MTASCRVGFNAAGLRVIVLEMASLISRIARFARSPQGKKLEQSAQQFIAKPENRRKIAELRSRLAKKR